MQAVGKDENAAPQPSLKVSENAGLYKPRWCSAMTIIKLHIGYCPEWNRTGFGFTAALLGLWFCVSRYSFPPHDWSFHVGCDWL